MRLTLSVRKTLEQSAAQYFEAAKKAKRKLEGAKLAAAKAKERVQKKQVVAAPAAKKEWYERFRWTKTAQGTLIIAGKDADSNETIIKKHADQNDTVLHTDMPGSPFAVIKGEASKEALHAASTIVACYSKAWKQGLSVADVFAVKPSQLSKTPNSGEFIGKGSFMVRGEKQYLQPKLELALGLSQGKPMAGTKEYFEEAKEAYLTLKPGAEKTSDTAKKLAKRFGLTSDAWSGLIPSGGCTITTHKNGQTTKRPE